MIDWVLHKRFPYAGISLLMGFYRINIKLSFSNIVALFNHKLLKWKYWAYIWLWFTIQTQSGLAFWRCEVVCDDAAPTLHVSNSEIRHLRIERLHGNVYVIGLHLFWKSERNLRRSWSGIYLVRAHFQHFLHLILQFEVILTFQR